jgi:arabinose-5-phosphate isomerase
MTDPIQTDFGASARRTIATEAAGLLRLSEALAGPLGEAFEEALALIQAARGRVIVTGMGKSGHVARKIVATLASTGTPASYVHPAEASHGDLGMIETRDVILALSWSGETRELADIIAYARRFGVSLIAITSEPGSALGREADVCLVVPKAEEACPNGLAPTTSTTLQMVLGDAIAVALLEARGFTPQDFRTFHPGGKLGAQLTFVANVMRKGEELPLVAEGTTIAEALPLMNARKLGSVLVQDGKGRLTGIITDGDLRRHMTPSLLSMTVETVMTAAPRTIRPDALAADAIHLLNHHMITQLPVVDGEDRPVGIVHIQDLLRRGVA